MVQIRQGGTWKDGKPYVRVAGTWQEVQEAHVRAGGTWHLAWENYSYWAATGGTVSDITVGGLNYRVHEFTASGDLVITAVGDEPVDYLIVGGGGRQGSGSLSSGSFRSLGAGGGGGVLTGTATPAVATHAVTVGSQMANSSVFSLTAIAGGLGARFTNAGTTGGSGGGGAYSSGAIRAPGSGTSGQGHAGGAANANGRGGGGGGKNSAGVAAGTYGGNGGAGLTSNITGTNQVYGPGGGGGGFSTNGGGPTGCGTAGLAGGTGAGNGATAQNAAGSVCNPPRYFDDGDWVYDSFPGTGQRGGGAGGIGWGGGQNAEYSNGAPGTGGRVIVRYRRP